MNAADLQSVIALTIQCAGIFLVAVLSFFMTRSIRRASLAYWAAGWAALAVALLALGVGFRIREGKSLYYAIYFLGEYVFGYLFLAGCRNYASGAQLTRRLLYLLIPAAAIAIGLSRLSSDFGLPFTFHAALLSGLFVSALCVLNSARRLHGSSPGLRVMRVALFLLALDFAHYFVVLAWMRLAHPHVLLTYLNYTSIYDLILEILLGFGTLMLVMDDARHEVEAANRELVAARDKLEVQARMDPLTQALNRHAFYSLLERRQPGGSEAASGCVVVIDIDNLKPINDSLGHSAGDAAIREVAHAVRSVIRADDLLFRWGGDEFLVLLFGMPESAARRRIADLNEILGAAELNDLSAPVSINVSYGLAHFSTMSQIEQAIDKADGAMYARKEARKLQERQAG